MKNKILADKGVTYERLNKTSARKHFDGGNKVYVMSIDRNPVTSLTSAVPYSIGGKSLMGGRIQSFDDVLEDFSTWLDTDGYGHIPQRYDAKHYRFSYWIMS